MNYAEEINAFYRLIQTQYTATDEIVLWHALMYQNYKYDWEEWFFAPNYLLQLNSGLSTKNLYKARNSLKEKGLIDFKQRCSPDINGTKLISYKMISFKTE
jgi:hypothetical protein